jgi:hypothetical protein
MKKKKKKKIYICQTAFSWRNLKVPKKKKKRDKTNYDFAEK